MICIVHIDINHYQKFLKQELIAVKSLEKDRIEQMAKSKGKEDSAIFQAPKLPLIKNIKSTMFNKEFMKYERLKYELDQIKNLCADQYFAVNKCQGGNGSAGTKCGKMHVERCYYPCIHFYMGNCKYGFNCLFSHSIKRQIVKPDPPKEICRKLYFQNFCPNGSKCRFSHDLREQACIFNSLGKCKFSDESCRFSHKEKIEVNVPCFFNLMGGCKNDTCENKHNMENITKYISYEGPL